MSFGLKWSSQHVGKGCQGSSHSPAKERKKYSAKTKRKNTPTASDIPHGNRENGHFVPLTHFLAVVGEKGQWWQNPHSWASCTKPRQGQKHLTNMAGAKGFRTGPKPSITWSRSWAAGSICLSSAIIPHFPARRQLTEQMSLKWLNVLSCYLFNSDVENVSHCK